MSEKIKFYHRFLADFLPSPAERKIVLLTGARQTGKTTLARRTYTEMRYINCDAPENRERLRNVETFFWNRDVGSAVIDEAQKESSIFEKIKYSFDEGLISFSVILGSSQILMLKNIRETLAGRIWVYELWPMMIAELVEGIRDNALLLDLLDAENIDSILNDTPSVLFDADGALRKHAEKYILQWGGMPSLLHLKSEQDRKQWLRDYIYTYLERDLLDLSRLNDLVPFQKFQKLSAHRHASLLNYSELARDAGVSVDTARRYIEYLKISYQVMLLQPYSRNIGKAIVKTPKIYWVDTGMVRQLIGYHDEEITGHLYENAIVAELYKYIKTFQKVAQMFFFRTQGGLEVDIVIETPKGILLIEIKNRDSIVKSDCTALNKVSEFFGNRLIGKILLYRGDTLYKIPDSNIWAVPSWRLFT